MLLGASNDFMLPGEIHHSANLLQREKHLSGVHGDAHHEEPEGIKTKIFNNIYPHDQEQWALRFKFTRALRDSSRCLSSATEPHHPCRTTATLWSKSIRHIKAGKAQQPALQKPVCMFVWRPAELSGSHHTQQSMQTDLTRTRRQLKRHKYTLFNTHSLYHFHWDCVCCGLLDLSMSLSAWVPFHSLSLSSFLLLGLAICSPCCGTRCSLLLQAFSHGGKKLSIGVKKKKKKRIKINPYKVM